ncbi:MAG: hypothetical protein GX262_01075, partial [Clostridia bacterium]|nr:hypothetical protein [Clostridia bacterium]
LVSQLKPEEATHSIPTIFTQMIRHNFVSQLKPSISTSVKIGPVFQEQQVINSSTSVTGEKVFRTHSLAQSFLTILGKVANISHIPGSRELFYSSSREQLIRHFVEKKGEAHQQSIFDAKIRKMDGPHQQSILDAGSRKVPEYHKQHISESDISKGAGYRGHNILDEDIQKVAEHEGQNIFDADIREAAVFRRQSIPDADNIKGAEHHRQDIFDAGAKETVVSHRQSVAKSDMPEVGDALVSQLKPEEATHSIPTIFTQMIRHNFASQLKPSINTSVKISPFFQEQQVINSSTSVTGEKVFRTHSLAQSFLTILGKVANTSHIPGSRELFYSSVREQLLRHIIEKKIGDYGQIIPEKDSKPGEVLVRKYDVPQQLAGQPIVLDLPDNLQKTYDNFTGYYRADGGGLIFTQPVGRQDHPVWNLIENRLQQSNKTTVAQKLINTGLLKRFAKNFTTKNENVFNINQNTTLNLSGNVTDRRFTNDITVPRYHRLGDYPSVHGREPSGVEGQNSQTPTSLGVQEPTPVPTGQFVEPTGYVYPVEHLFLKTEGDRPAGGRQTSPVMNVVSAGQNSITNLKNVTSMAITQVKNQVIGKFRSFTHKTETNKHTNYLINSNIASITEYQRDYLAGNQSPQNISTVNSQTDIDHRVAMESRLPDGTQKEQPGMIGKSIPYERELINRFGNLIYGPNLPPSEHTDGHTGSLLTGSASGISAKSYSIPELEKRVLQGEELLRQEQRKVTELTQKLKEQEAVIYKLNNAHSLLQEDVAAKMSEKKIRSMVMKELKARIRLEKMRYGLQ